MSNVRLFDIIALKAFQRVSGLFAQKVTVSNFIFGVEINGMMI
jgi:hypothetical protein